MNPSSKRRFEPCSWAMGSCRISKEGFWVARGIPNHCFPSGLTRGPLIACAVLREALGSSPRENRWGREYRDFHPRPHPHGVIPAKAGTSVLWAQKGNGGPRFRGDDTVRTASIQAWENAEPLTLPILLNAELSSLSLKGRGWVRRLLRPSAPSPDIPPTASHRAATPCAGIRTPSCRPCPIARAARRSWRPA